MMCADMIPVVWREQSGKSRRTTGLLEDISESGACLQLELAVPLGVSIEWSTPNQAFSGHVRYCVYREIGYFVGVEFDPASKWSEESYKPQHLLDLEKLIKEKS